MDFLEPLTLNMAQTISLVPAGGEDVKRYLSTNGEGKVVFSEPLLQDFYEGNPDAVDLSERVRDRVFLDDEGAEPYRRLRTHDVLRSYDIVS